MSTKRPGAIDAVFVGILLVVFGGVVLHAPFSVAFSTLFPDQALIFKAWKEILMGAALLLAIVILTMRRQWAVIKTPFIYVIAVFAGLNVALALVSSTGVEAIIAGLLINLRYLLFFVLVYVAIRLYPQWYRAFIVVFVAGALVVVVFAVLQVTVLPHDVLQYLGYGKETIMPYLTVDENMNYIRINSTLRGPNPLGAYAVIVLAFALCAWLMATRKLKKSELWVLGILGVGSAAALWASYARSAALAAVVAVAIVVLVVYGRRINKSVWVALGIASLVIVGSLVALRDTQFVSQVILHEDPLQGNAVNSNEGHTSSLIDGARLMLTQPIGGGIGSTGSASLIGNQGLIIENQYLFIAHETGWLGIVLFLILTYMILYRLWVRRRHWLALSVFASGVGLVVAGLVLPVWADDTVSIVWWGLAAVALAMPFAPLAAKHKISEIS